MRPHDGAPQYSRFKQPARPRWRRVPPRLCCWRGHPFRQPHGPKAVGFRPWRRATEFLRHFLADKMWQDACLYNLISIDIVRDEIKNNCIDAYHTSEESLGTMAWLAQFLLSQEL